jgi:hypothetical protein
MASGTGMASASGPRAPRTPGHASTGGRTGRLAGLALGGLAVLVLTTALAGCGSSSGAAKALEPGASPAQRKLERTDLAIVSHGLLGAERTVEREVSASRAAWPAVAQGLPALVSPAEQRAIATASVQAQRIATPRFISYAGELTGASAAIAGLLLSYEGLTQRGWTFTLAAAAAGGAAGEAPGESSLQVFVPARGTAPQSVAQGTVPAVVSRQLASASPAALHFLRTNASLYIGYVYDGHYNLSTIGEYLTAAYSRLGGPASFGAALPAGEVASVARFYSPANARLSPRPAALATGS